MRRNLLFLLLGVLLSFGMSAHDTDAMLFGDVKSKTTGEHLPYATIKVKGTQLVTHCDGSGHFNCPTCPLASKLWWQALWAIKLKSLL